MIDLIKMRAIVYDDALGKEEEFVEIPADMKEKAEEYRVVVRNLRRDANDAIKKTEKAKEITEDEAKKGTEKVQKLTDKVMKESTLQTS